MKTLALLLALFSCAIAQTTTAGSTKTVGTTQASASTPAAFKPLTFATDNYIAPSNVTGSFGAGFPSVTGGNPAEGYQGGLAVNANLILFTPQMYNQVTPHGTLLAYTGGPTGTFHCSGSGAGSCASNFDWFDMTTLSLSCPSGATCPTSPADSATGYTCGQVVDNNGIVYYIPGVDQQRPAMMSFNPAGSNGAGGSPVSNSANYAGFNAPSAGTSGLGYKYGWCTGVFDGRYVYYTPTAGGSTFSNSNFLRYDTTGVVGGTSATWPATFVLANFTSVNLSSSGILNDPNACCFLSSVYDGGQYIYLLPINNGGTMVRYNKALSFITGTSYTEFLFSTLGTSGHPQVTGNGNLHNLQTATGFVGGQMVWNVAGTTEYMYMAPFATNPNGTAQAGQILNSTVIRVPVATCSPGVADTQTCTGTFTALDITSSGSTWEIFDLANLAANQEWSIAGYPYPPIFGGTIGYATQALANQLVLGGFQLTWLNVHNTADPVVGFVADFGKFYARHHAAGSLSDPSMWDLVEIPSSQHQGCMGGGYDAVNQLLYTSCPAATPLPSAWQLGPL